MKSLTFGSANGKGDVYYVCIDNIEEIKDGSLELILDGVEKGKLPFFTGSTLVESFEEFNPFLFSINLSKDYFEFFQPARFKSKWYELIVTDKKTGLKASVYTDRYVVDEPIFERYVARIKQLSTAAPASKKLDKYFSWKDFKFSNTNQILSAVNENLADEFYLNVYNVGQGSLTALVDINNIPILYYDLGGGFAWNKFTYTDAQTLQLCFSQTNTIIISHWDNDHLETAKRYLRKSANAFLGFTWIAPEQNISPSYFKLAAKLNSTGNLIIWPKNLRGYISCWLGKIIKCNGPDKNNSGLALELETATGRILNPADAAYTHIPYTKTKKYKGLVATHHGANFPVNNSPVPLCVGRNIAYSYGNANKYGHPKGDSLIAHTTGSWTNRLDTNNGHISFGNSSPMPCPTTHCNLNIVQIF